jgi:hypothetical protein
MSLRLSTFICRAALCAGLGLMIASCSTTKATADQGGKITKVKYFHLANFNPIPSGDPSIPFEREYILRGAISNKDRTARLGHYYSVMWKVTDRSQPVKVRFEYRQEKTGLAVKSQEQDVSKVGGSNLTRFAVTGDEYVTGGPVNCWRVSLVRGKQVLAEEKSYLWD